MAPLRIAETELRCGGVAWGDDDLALLYESRYKDRRSVTWAFSPGEAEREARAAKASAPSSAPSALSAGRKRIVFDLPDYEDAYSNPGSPLLARTPRGTYVLARPDGKRALLLAGSGATPEGLRPFLDVLDLGGSSPPSPGSDGACEADEMTSTRLWRSSPPNFESAGSILSDGLCDRGGVALDGLRLLLSRESADVPPQTFIATFEGVSMSDLSSKAEKVPAGEAGGAPSPAAAAAAAKRPSAATLLLSPRERQLTAFPHPHPSLTGAQKRVLRYERSDGVPLTATLHTPPGYDAARDGPLPTFVWLYPREFKNKEAAGQMRRSPHEFSGVGSSSPLLFLTRGYAVLDGPTFPIVAEV
jgi:dipeptidyl aminopeptidase/acylaminoacyl peptidase